MVADQIIQDLELKSSKEKIIVFKRFFKTDPGQYGEGDQFLGITVPQVREVAKRFYKETRLVDLEKLISSPFHEIRLVALIILTYQFPKASDVEKKRIVDFYLKNKIFINNWDLVDLSAHKILGAYLIRHPEELLILNQLSNSNVLWDKRISVLTTFAFIKINRFGESLRLVEKYLVDKHDLMHKACGWMLREIGKKDEKVLITFLEKHYKKMPRTMLRYSIERLTSDKKRYFMQKNT